MVHEISIEKFIANDRSPASLEDLKGRGRGVEDAVFASDVVAEVAASSAHVLLVRVAGPGGHFEGSKAIRRALRAFSDRGGRVVTLLSGPRVGSSAPSVALAGDHVLAVPEAGVQLHSCGGPTPGLVAEANLEMASALAECTAMPPGAIEACLSYVGWVDDGTPQVATLDLDEILKNGFADAAATLEHAQAFAQTLGLVLSMGGTPLPKRHEEGGSLAKLRRARRGASFEILPGRIMEPERSPVVSFSITAEKIEGNAIRTTNFSSTGTGVDEVASAGAKMQRDGVAFVTCKDGMKVGKYTLEEMFALMAASNRNPLTLSTTGTSRFYGIAYSQPANRYVACGAGFISTSDNQGLTWTARSTAAGPWFDVNISGPLWVVVGRNGCYTSADSGTTWTSRAIGTGEWFKVVWTGAYYWALDKTAGSNKVARSSDGITWAITTLPVSAPGGWTGIAARPAPSHHYVMVGTNWNGSSGTGIVACYLTGASSTTWSSLTLPSNTYEMHHPGIGWSNIFSDAGYFTIVGGAGKGWTAPAAGGTWEQYTYSLDATELEVHDIARSNLIFVAACSWYGSGLILLSHNGKDWRYADASELLSVDGVAWAAGSANELAKFVFVGHPKVVGQPNGGATMTFQP